MIRTRICELLGIEHPIVLGGMSGATSPRLVAAVSNAGGLGTLGASALHGEEVHAQLGAIREATDRPFAVNFLLFDFIEEGLTTVLDARPAVLSFAWARADQDLRPYFDKAHAVGARVMFMVSTVAEAKRGAVAGADVIVAQGTEAGGHVGWMASMPLIPMVVDTVAPLPVLAAGGIADGRGLAAALVLGADGVLLGTRFLATEESPIHSNFKDAIVQSDGHDTLLTEIPDITTGRVWPGAMARAWHNRFIERWAGREWALRQQRTAVFAGVEEARNTGDAENARLLFGQDAGLINSILPVETVISHMVAEAEEILSGRLPGVVRARGDS